MRRWLAGLATVSLGVILLGLATPRLVANLLLLPGNTAVFTAFSGGVLSSDGYQRIFDTREAALRWVDMPDVEIELGGTLYYLLQSAGAYEFDEAVMLREARGLLESGLARAPVTPHAWLWLSEVRFAMGDEGGAAEALRLSLVSSPLQPNLAQLRALMTLRVWGKLRPDARRLAGLDVARTLNSGGRFALLREAEGSGKLDLLRAIAAEVGYRRRFGLECRDRPQDAAAEAACS